MAKTPDLNLYNVSGGKFSNHDGGVRVVSFAAGGYLPRKVRGSVNHNLISTADWYATFATLAGVDPTDHRAAMHDLPPIDAIDQSAVILGQRGNARQDIILSGLLAKDPVRFQSSRGIVAVDPAQEDSQKPTCLYKLLLGEVKMATWSGARFANSSSSAVDYQHMLDNCSSGCLYELFSDPTEHKDISAQHPDIVATLRSRLEAAESTAWVPSRGKPLLAACDRARYSRHYGPFLNASSDDQKSTVVYGLLPMPGA